MRTTLPYHDTLNGSVTLLARLTGTPVNAEVILKIASTVNPIDASPIALDALLQNMANTHPKSLTLLWCQMVGRGFRLHPGKQNCLVLDFGENALRHGPVDQIRVRENGPSGNATGGAPAKECPECHALIAAGYTVCPDCGYEFPAREKANHDANASKLQKSTSEDG